MGDGNIDLFSRTQFFATLEADIKSVCSLEEVGSRDYHRGGGGTTLRKEPQK